MLFLFCFASPISLLHAGLMSRACLAVGVHLGVKQVYAEVAVKAVALGRVCHMRHGMHACSHSLAVVCNPYGAPVPRKALQAQHYGGVFFCYGLAVRIIPAAEAQAEAIAKESEVPEYERFSVRKVVDGKMPLFAIWDDLYDDYYETNHAVPQFSDEKQAESYLENLKKEVAEQHIKEPMECKQLLINEIKEQMRVDSTEYEFENRKSVILVIGVNGVGKTTSVGKLAGKLKDQGKKVILAAADTFRAAAGEQLTQWANRAGVEIIGGQSGADPASVVYDAVAAAKARNADVLLCDTAGRLHNKKNLMEELRKIYKILEREYPEAYLETLVVLDGTTGQNALSQARQFAEVANVNGIILTKLDGTAKGGIAVAIQSELDIPVKYIGVGVTLEDLQKFDADAFVNALFDVDHKDEPDN